MEVVKQIKIPVIADSVLSPDFFYDDYTGIYFVTSSDDKYGRITFENLDAVKICRGEHMLYKIDYSLVERGVWIFQIENAKWQKERIARGFWFEESGQSLFKKDLVEGHPFLHLPLENSEIMTAYSLKHLSERFVTYKVRHISIC